MRILLFGSNGQVGAALRAISRAEVIPLSRNECDLRYTARVRSAIRDAAPDAIVNAAAYTAVDKAESDREACFAINAVAPGTMAMEAAALGVPLLHYSTDYVFNGRKPAPYSEEDPTGPLNVYGASKLEGEQAVAAAGGRFAILRTSWVYSNHGSNFLNSMLRLGSERPELRVVNDQAGAPTAASAIAAATLGILERPQSFPAGVYHMTAAGQTTWFGFAAKIFALAGLSPKLEAIPSAGYPTPAQRPQNSVLANDKFQHTFGFRLPSWEEQLCQVFAQRTEALAQGKGE